MALSPMVLWAGAATGTLAVAGAGAALWTYANLGTPELPALTEPKAAVAIAHAPEAPAAVAPAPAAKPPAPAPVKEAAAPPPAPPAPPPAIRPAFDIVNVSPAGETVVAGTAA